MISAYTRSMAATPLEVQIKSPVNTEMPKAVPVKKEQPTPSQEKRPIGVSRKQLEDIAAGKPVLETITAQENLLSRDVVMQMLQEANALLLDMKDLRLIMSSLATQSADTPLGHQMQMEVLRMLKEIPVAGVSPDLAPQLTALQTKLGTLPIPEANTVDNPLISTIQSFNITHPDQRVPEELLSKIQSGDVKSSEMISSILEGNQQLAQTVWKELTGQEEFKGFAPTPEIILDLSGISKTPENLKKAQDIFATAAPLKEKPDMVGKMMSGVLIGALSLQFVSQMVTNESSSQH